MRRNTRAKDKIEAPAGRLVGYARVSTWDQSLDLQVDALLRAGVHPDNVHTEHVSGVAKNRPGLRNALLDAVDGDTFVVWKFDRLGRSLLDLLTRIDELTKRGVKFRSLTEGIDTATPAGMMMLNVIGAIAQFERDMIRERTLAGMASARQRGAKFGAPRKLDLAGARDLFRAGKNVREVAEHFDCSTSAVYNQFKWNEIERLQRAGAKKRTK